MKAKDLKNSILQMAIEGKLVPQDPNDEPASVLLERIREEKHKLIAEGKAKFPKGGESIIYIGSDGSPYEKRVDAKGHVTSDKCIANEMPFEELPEGWCWTRLSNVASIQLGKMLDKQKNQGDLAPYLGNANVQWGRFDLANVKTMPMDEMDRAKYALSDGDLIPSAKAAYRGDGQSGHRTRRCIIKRRFTGSLQQKAAAQYLLRAVYLLYSAIARME